MMEDLIRQWYRWGLWTEQMVQEAVPQLLTSQQADKIIHEKETAEPGRTKPAERRE